MSKKKKQRKAQPIILNIKHLNVGERTYIRNYYPQGFCDLSGCCEGDEDYDDEEQDGDPDEP